MLITADRVKETTTTTGTGAVTLEGAVAGFRSFASVCGDGDTVGYCIETQVPGGWETGIGTFSAGTLQRTTVIASSNAGAAVDFAAGTKAVFLTFLGSQAASIFSRLDTAESGISTAQTDIGALQTRAATDEVDISNVEGRATSLETRATALEGRATTDEADIAALQSDMALKAPLADPTFTGHVTVPVPSSTMDATTKQYVDTAVAAAPGLSSRATVVTVTGSLADLAVENGTMTIAKSAPLLKISADRACRVVLYPTADARTADASRNLGTPAPAGIGVLAEVAFNAAGSIFMSPVPILDNGDSPATSTIYYAIQNRSGSTSTVTVTTVSLKIEA